MYAIVETSGKQYRVAPGEVIIVDQMKAEVGSTVTLDRVLLLHGDAVTVGTPTIVDHHRGEKLRSFKYLRTRRYRRRHGYRHHNTRLEILDITG